MKDLLSSSSLKDNKKVFFSLKNKEEDRLDIFLYFLMTLLTAVFCLGHFFSEGKQIEHYTGFTILGHFISFRLDGSLNLALFLPFFFIFIAIEVYFLLLRYNKTGKTISRKLLALFVGIVVFRFLTNFCFPYGETAFTLTATKTGTTYDLLYSGYTIQDRFVSFLSENVLLSYFLLTFTYLKTFSSRFEKLNRVLLVGVILLALIMNIYSYRTEASKITQNIQYLFGLSSEGLDISITSFTSHRNTYGFFVLMAGISSFILAATASSKSKPLFLVLLFYFCVTAFLIKSRTPSFLLFALFFLYLIYVIIFLRRSDTKLAIACVLILTFFLALVLLAVVFSDSKEMQHLLEIWDIYKDKGSIDSRMSLNTQAFDMLSSPYYVLFGYGRIPFIAVFNLLGKASGNQLLWSSHNGFIDVLLSYGVIGLIVTLLGHAYLLYLCIREIVLKNERGILYLLIEVLLIVYAFFEPRLLFGIEPTQVFMIIVVLWPIMKERQSFTERY